MFGASVESIPDRLLERSQPRLFYAWCLVPHVHVPRLDVNMGGILFEIGQ